MQCNETDEAWYLTCKGRSWVGHVGNCSEPVLYGESETIVEGMQCNICCKHVLLAGGSLGDQ